LPAWVVVAGGSDGHAAKGAALFRPTILYINRIEGNWHYFSAFIVNLTLSKRCRSMKKFVEMTVGKK
jgi:hypothetical protein